MKSILIPIFMTVFGVNSALACPNLSGEYRFEKDFQGGLNVTQTGCESIQVQFVRSTGTYTATLRTDGQPYENSWDSSMNSNADQPASPESYSFEEASYSDARFIWDSFEGDRTQCVGKYSFSSFDCKEFEHSLGYDSDQKSYTWTQIAWWRSGNGTYAQDVFYLTKVH